MLCTIKSCASYCLVNQALPSHQYHVALFLFFGMSTPISTRNQMGGINMGQFSEVARCRAIGQVYCKNLVGIEAVELVWEDRHKRQREVVAKKTLKGSKKLRSPKILHNCLDIKVVIARMLSSKMCTSSLCIKIRTCSLFIYRTVCCSRLTLELLNIGIKVHDCFLMAQPDCHLRHVFPFVACMVGIFGKFNVKLFRRFGVVAVQ